MSMTLTLDMTSCDSLDSSWNEHITSTDEAPKPKSPISSTHLTRERSIKVEVVAEAETAVKVKSEVKVEDKEDDDLIRAFDTLTVDLKTEDLEANGNELVKDEDEAKPSPPPSPKRKGVFIAGFGAVEKPRDERLYFVAKGCDTKSRIYYWNIRNKGINSVFYIDPSDDWNHRFCESWYCESGTQIFLIGCELYRSNYQTCTLEKCEFAEVEFQQLDITPGNWEQAWSQYIELRPDSSTTPDFDGDCRLVRCDPDTNNPMDVWDHIVNMTSTGLLSGLAHGVPGVETEPPSPESNQAPDPPILEPIPDVPGDPVRRQKMILPRGDQPVLELECFVDKVVAELKKLGGKWRVKCSTCEKSPSDSKRVTLLRHILPHYGHQYSCDICDAVIAQKGNINRHKRDVHHICCVCKDQFESRPVLQAHKENRHFMCNGCEKQFKGAIDLTAHMRECTKLAQAAAKGKGGRGGGGGARMRNIVTRRRSSGGSSQESGEASTSA